MENLRYALVTAGGFLIDITTAYLLITIGGAPLSLGAATGFVVAAGANYACHELWTFRTGHRQLCTRRALQYLAAALATLIVRLGAVLLLEAVLTDTPGGDYGSLLILLTASGISLVFNFALSKFVVFAARRQPIL